MGGKTNVKALLVLVIFLLESCGLLRLTMAKGPQAGKAEEKKKTEAQLPVGASDNWWAAVQDQIRQAEYKIRWQEQAGLEDLDGAYQAPNRAHNLRTFFAPEGIRIVQRTESSSIWQWGLCLTGYGYAGAAKTVDKAKLVVSGDRIEYVRGEVVEWYVNDEKGLEQGFTLFGPPEGNGEKTQKEIVLEMSVAGDLKGRMSRNGKTVTFATSGGKEVINYGGLVVKDAAGRELGSWILLSGDRITLKIDKSGARYPVTIDPVITSVLISHDWMAEGDQIQAHFGYSVGMAGDVNGDGFDDVIVGAPLYDNGQYRAGAAFVYHGSVAGLSLDPNWTVGGGQTNNSFGFSVATAGDVNGDGYCDVIVGDIEYVNGEISEGAAFVFHGSASGLSLMANWKAEVNQAHANLGYSVSTAGDVNGDGYSDVIVASFDYNYDQVAEGAVFVYHGSASGLSAEANRMLHGDQAYATFGCSVSTAGDVNGDGFCDIIVGSSDMAFVYHGSASGLSASANWTALGSSVGSAGDVNGDGFCDVIVGSSGMAFVYHGSASGLSASANWTALGSPVGTAGDVNGDGYADVITGSSEKAFVYQGSATGLLAGPIWTLEGGQAGARFGSSVGTAGDTNGDGLSDVIVGAPRYDNVQYGEGLAFVYYGRCWLKADLTGDCTVNYFDFAKLAKDWLQPSLVVDLTGNSYIDYFDLDVLVLYWLGENNPPPGAASNPNPPDGASTSDYNADLSWTAGVLTESHDVYFGTSSPPPFVGNQTTPTFDPGIMTIGAKYYWRINEVGSYDTTLGPVWSFTIMTPPPPPPPLPGPASNPNPADGATDVSTNTDLGWSAGSYATSHDVYFGTIDPPPFVRNQTSTTFDPGIMEGHTTYNWRIDEVNSSGKTTGTVWSFTTGATPPPPPPPPS